MRTRDDGAARARPDPGGRRRTDVMLWWGHEDHPGVDDDVVDRVHAAVLGGMGIIVLHSGHYSKIFRRAHGHDVLAALAQRRRPRGGLDGRAAASDRRRRARPARRSRSRRCTASTSTSPRPDELIFLSSFSGGEVFRSGATWTPRHGRVFYFSPGDQEYPGLPHPGIRRVLANGVRWALPSTPQRAARRHASTRAAGSDRTQRLTPTCRPCMM